jgi:DNA-binding LytR/AlgR family response regulator
MRSDPGRSGFIRVIRVRTRHAASAGTGRAARSARSGRTRPTSPRRAVAERIPIVEKGRISFVALDDVERIEGKGDYVRVHAGSRSHLVRQTLGALERRLDPTRFVRVHRSTIVRVIHHRGTEDTEKSKVFSVSSVPLW